MKLACIAFMLAAVISRLFSQTIQMDSSRAEAYFKRACVHGGMGNFHGVVEDASKVIELQPGRGEAYQIRAAGYMELKDYGHAIPDLVAAARLLPADSSARRAQLLVNLGYCRFEVSNLSMSQESFEEALTLNGSHRDALLGLALVSMEDGDTEKARTQFARAVEVEPLLGSAKGDVGMLEKAGIHFSEKKKRVYRQLIKSLPPHE